MFCIYCGNKLADDADSCPVCGKAVSVSLRPQGDAPSGQHAAAAHGSREGKSSAKRRQWVLVPAAAILVLVVLVLGLTLGRRGAGTGGAGSNPAAPSDPSAAAMMAGNGGSSADPLPGLWEERVRISDEEVFLTTLELRPNGEAVFWDGYENSEVWDYYSGSYSRLEEDGNGSCLLELHLSGEDGEYTTRIRVSISGYSSAGQPALTLVYDSGDMIPMLGDAQRVFSANSTQPAPEEDSTSYPIVYRPSSETPQPVPTVPPVQIPWASAGVPDHVMSWGNDAMKSAMQTFTGIRDRDIMLSDVWEITELTLSLGYDSDDSYRMSALRELKNLVHLNITCSEYENLEFLWELPCLRSLTLDGHLRDISALSGCTNLEKLRLSSSYFWDLSALGGLSSLKELSLTAYQVTDIGPIGNLRNLETLYLDCSNLADLSPLSSLPALRELTVDHGDSIRDIRPLEKLGTLEKLSLTNCRISDVSPLSGLHNLTVLEVMGSPLSDVGPLRGLTNLQTLNLFADEISDVSPLQELKNLRELYLHENNISQSDRAALQAALPYTSITWEYY